MPIAAATTVGAVQLTVAELARSLAYYREAIGLDVLAEGGGEASLGAGGRELLHLLEEPGARPADGFAGLFHFALLVPERADLAAWLQHAIRDRVLLTGASDHFVSEALYLRDPDHHGIEIYADRPRELWDGQANRIGTWPLDVDDLLAAASEPVVALPAGTRMGHVHLRVADVAESVRFYRDLVGFDLIAQLGSEAAFLSAGGYHHHLGANTWESRGAAAAPEGTARLLGYTIVVPDEAERDRVLARLDGASRDPSGNRFELVAGGV
ncbi:MAG TPA: VOC family protein [Gaiellaceae bacterium]|nr:VOC family protein [Gaiellaceae bacterium]